MKLLRVRFNVPKPISVREPMIPDKNGESVRLARRASVSAQIFAPSLFREHLSYSDFLVIVLCL